MRWQRLFRYSILCSGLVVADQIIKAQIQFSFTEQDSIVLISKFFLIVHKKFFLANLVNFKWINQAVTILTIGILALLVPRLFHSLKTSGLKSLGIYLGMTGLFSNLIDVNYLGYVFHYFQITIFSTKLSFNVADICIVLFLITIVLNLKFLKFKS